MSLSNAGGGSDIWRVVRVLHRRVRVPLSALSFWFAIALPVVYLSLLAWGIESTEGLLLFLGLLGMHVVALIGGRDHAETSRE